MSYSWTSSFFFSSRRRHTRWPRDWSSDVCSSDLPKKAQFPAATASSVPFITAPPVFENRDIRAMGLSLTTTHSSSGQLVEKHIEGSNPTAPGNDEISPGDTIDLVAATNEIGRASCRERV